VLGTPVQDIPTLNAVDNDGTISGYVIKTLPSGGKLYKNGTLITSITGGGLNITTVQAGSFLLIRMITLEAQHLLHIQQKIITIM
jgi:hypothetical protein